VTSETCVVSGERTLCVQLINDLHNDRWKSFSCSNMNSGVSKVYISLDELYQHWRNYSDDPFTEKLQVVFKIPDLMSHTLRLLGRRRSQAKKDTLRLLQVAESFMPTEIYEALEEFEESDWELANCGPDLSKHAKFWQGYTGAESLIFIKALKRIWDNPFSFLEQDLTEYYEQQLCTAAVKIGKLSPAIHRAECIRKRYVKELMFFQGLSQQLGGE